MSKADKMFDDMGYQKSEEYNYIIYNIGNIEVQFDKNNEIVRTAQRIKGKLNLPMELDYRDIKAIHEKMKELGWIKPTEVLDEYKDHLEDLEFTHEDLCE